tara:strand:+ start:1059 stop:1322 length:264 start_codon:yes stop_codon:yes gene_type:complete
MKVLSRTAKSLEDALESLDVDGPNLAITETGLELPFYTKLYITPAKIENFFKIEEWSNFEIKVFVFEDHEEQTKFLLSEGNYENKKS